LFKVRNDASALEVPTCCTPAEVILFRSTRSRKTFVLRRPLPSVARHFCKTVWVIFVAAERAPILSQNDSTRQGLGTITLFKGRSMASLEIPRGDTGNRDEKHDAIAA
jgi:hypothetical protein